MTSTTKADIAFAPTTGFYSVSQRGTTIVLKNFLKSLEEATDWCKANGWELPEPSPTTAITALVDACNEALGERANYSGMSDDSEPVLSSVTRNKLRAAIAAARPFLPVAKG